MSKNLISKSAFARRAGVSPAAITNNCQPDRVLHEAVDPVTNKIDLDHPAVAAYEKSKNIKIKISAAETMDQQKEVEQKPEDLDRKSELKNKPVSDLAKMTLPELVEIFGTDERFKVWLQAWKLIVDIQAREIANAEKMGTLISRQLVKDHIIGSFNNSNLRLMTDGAKAIAVECHALAKSGASVTELEIQAQDIIEKHLKGVKNKVAKALK